METTYDPTTDPLGDLTLLYPSLKSMLLQLWEGSPDSVPTKQNLLDQGWNEKVVDDALDSLPAAAKVVQFVSGLPEPLTPIQLATVESLLAIGEPTKNSLTAKLAELGVSLAQYRKWLKLPHFSEYLRKRASELFGASAHLSFNNVLSNVDAGDLNAAKFHLELLGLYTPRAEINVSLTLVLQRVVEVIARNVKDPEQLEAIANELDGLGQATPQLNARS